MNAGLRTMSTADAEERLTGRSSLAARIMTPFPRPLTHPAPPAPAKLAPVSVVKSPEKALSNHLNRS